MKFYRLTCMTLLVLMGLALPLAACAQTVGGEGDSTESGGGRVTEWYSSASVDMGLSVNWGECNLGAHQCYEIGYYYAWGETETKDEFSAKNYKYCNGKLSSLTKYVVDSSLGVVDSLTQLEPADDAATVKIGSDAHIPTAAEWQELLDNTTITCESVNGVDGCRFTSRKNGNSIFIPYGGCNDGTEIDEDYLGQIFCWSSTLYENRCKAAHIFYTYPKPHLGNYFRDYGMNIRPVFAADRLSVSADSIDFGSLEPGSSASENVTVTNVSSDTIEYSVCCELINSQVGNSFHLEGEANGADGLYTLLPGQSATHTIIYDPQNDSKYYRDYVKYIVSVNGSHETHHVILTGKCIYADKSTLIAWQKDGSRVKFNLRDEPKITFMNGSILIEVPSSTFSYEAGTIQKMTYELDPDDVEPLEEADDKAFVQNGESLSFVASDKDLNVRIVATSGIVTREFLVQKGSTASVRLSELVPGVYLVNVNDVTYKVNVR